PRWIDNDLAARVSYIACRIHFSATAIEGSTRIVDVIAEWIHGIRKPDHHAAVHVEKLAAKSCDLGDTRRFVVVDDVPALARFGQKISDGGLGFHVNEVVDRGWEEENSLRFPRHQRAGIRLDGASNETQFEVPLDAA